MTPAEHRALVRRIAKRKGSEEDKDKLRQIMYNLTVGAEILKASRNRDRFPFLYQPPTDPVSEAQKQINLA